MKTITVSKSSINGGSQHSKLNITEQHLPISVSSASKPYSQETTFSFPYIKNSQTIPARHINLKSNPAEDEIRIFDAQKYINEGNAKFQNHTVKLSPVRESEKYDWAEFRYPSFSSPVNAYSARSYQAKSFHTSPAASSEASWNSQTALMSNPPHATKVSLSNLNPVNDEKRKKNNPRWFFGCTCPCKGKKSIQVDDKTIPSQARSRINSRSTNLSRQTDEIPTPARKITNSTTLNAHRFLPEEVNFTADQPPLRISLTAKRNINNGAGFSLPILKPSTQFHNRITKKSPRDSLEDFHHPRSREIPGPKTMTPNMIEDDDASESSSDLFEIEIFSVEKTYQTHQNIHRDLIDEVAANFQNPRRPSVITSTTNNHLRKSVEVSEMVPTEPYEPSEVSIDWSVTTAEALDRV
ncbi:hypothetical protein QQ045_022767 [Rhodiola kirilowii]